jgi:hypothetical protein
MQQIEKQLSTWFDPVQLGRRNATSLGLRAAASCQNSRNLLISKKTARYPHPSVPNEDRHVHTVREDRKGPGKHAPNEELEGLETEHRKKHGMLKQDDEALRAIIVDKLQKSRDHDARWMDCAQRANGEVPLLES